MDTGESVSMETIEEAANYDLSHKFLTFRVAGQYFGIAIQTVIEILQLQEITPMPELPYYSKGIINMRGRVVPIIDLSLRFNKPEQEYSDRTCIIIVDINGTYVGFLVEAVEEVRDIDREMISPPPAYVNDGSSTYVIGIGKLERYMVLLLDGKLILSDGDMSALAGF
ncbi:MAG: chemotaxis protein CheW [Oscillospiraceae bacterium]|nr:chemotaxis protein CheW [Oscillospiraceae bacterium]